VAIARQSFKARIKGRTTLFLKTGVVEAAGVEPASEKVPRKKTTCVSGSVVFVRPMRNRQEGSGLARLISAGDFEQQPWAYPAKMTSSGQRAGSLTQNGSLIN